jgi:hypothetical protein
LGPYLAGLFLIAQIFGVMPLVSGHIAHVAQTELELSEGQAALAQLPQQHHHRGDADGSVQHHALQDLSGVVAGPAQSCEVVWVRVTASAPEPDALTEADPVRLERPPKPILSV